MLKGPAGGGAARRQVCWAKAWRLERVCGVRYASDRRVYALGAQGRGVNVGIDRGAELRVPGRRPVDEGRQRVIEQSEQLIALRELARLNQKLDAAEPRGHKEAADQP